MVINHFKYVLLLLLINTQIHLSAQDSEYDFSAYNKRNIKVESPNAIGMMQYGNNPVDLSRGTISQQIALYHYEDADFKLPINISYSNNECRRMHYPTGTWTGRRIYGQRPWNRFLLFA